MNQQNNQPVQFRHSAIDKGDWEGAQWTFTASMIGSCRPLFDHCNNNYEVEEELKEAGVIHPKNETDSESCQMFVYFSSKQSGENFVDRLNEYLRYLHDVPLKKTRARGFKTWKRAQA